MLYAVATFIIASSLLTRKLYDFTKNETWIAVIIACAISAALISVYGRLAANHPGVCIVEINAQVFGKIFGGILSALYVFYFLTLTALNMNDFGNFVSFAVLPNTPVDVVYVAFLAVCAYAVKKGAVALTRYAAVITIASIVLLLFTALLGLNKTNPNNLLPVLTLPVKKYLLSAHFTTMLPFCEIFVFLMFTPYMQKPAELGRAMKKGLFVGAATLLFTIVRDTSALGRYALYAVVPTYETIRLIDIGDILTRLEIIYAVTLIVLLFYKVSVLLFTTVSGISRLFGTERHEIYILITSALVVICAGTFFQSSKEHERWFAAAAASYSTFFLFVLPAATLIVSEIRNKIRQRPGNVQSAGNEDIC
jgi:spore germination protein KB